MEINKVIITSNNKISDLIIKRFNLDKSQDGDFVIYKGVRKNNGEIENIILVKIDIINDSIEKKLDYLFDNFEIEKLINIGIAKNLENIDYNIGDVILPNTFLEDDNENAIFLEYAIGESFDLNKFGLILSGLCVTTKDIEIFLENNNDIGEFIYEQEAHTILKIAEKNNILNKSVVIKEVNNNDKLFGNCIDVMELIL